MIEGIDQFEERDRSKDLTDDDVRELVQQSGAPLLASPETTLYLRRCRSLINLMAWTRNDIAIRNWKSRPSAGQKIRKGVNKLLKQTSKELNWLEHQAALDIPALNPFPDRARAKLAQRIETLKRLHQTLAETVSELPDEKSAEIDPRRHDPAVLVALHLYFERMTGSEKLSKSGANPAVRFISLVIKRIGWDEMEPGAIEQMLLRERKKRRSGFYHKKYGT